METRVGTNYSHPSKLDWMIDADPVRLCWYDRDWVLGFG